MSGVVQLGDYMQRLIVVCEPIDQAEGYLVGIVVTARDASAPVREGDAESFQCFGAAMTCALGKVRPGLPVRFLTAAEQLGDDAGIAA